MLKNYRIKTDETIVKNVDAELIEDREYASMGKTPADRIKTFLGKVDSVRGSQARGSEVSNRSKALFHKFMEQVDKIFNNRPNTLEWQSFYRHDLPLLMDISKEGSESEFKWLTNPGPSSGVETGIKIFCMH